MKKIAVKVAKVFIWGTGIILSILIILIIAIQIPYVQNKVKDFAISFVQDKIGTPVHLDRIEISFPKTIVVKGLYLESQEQDTLLAAQYVGVDISLFKLLRSTVEVNKVDLEGFSATVKRDTLQRFNFDYIIEAFASEDTPDDSSSSMKIEVGQINLKSIHVKFDDDYDGYHANLKLGEFTTRFKEFDLDEMKFAIPKIAVNKLNLVYHKALAYGEREDVQVNDSLAPASSAPLPKISLGDVSFKNIAINYEDQDNLMAADLQLSEFLASFDLLDLEGQQVDLKEIKLKKTTANVRLLLDKQAKTTKIASVAENETTKEEVAAAQSIPWSIGIKDFALADINLSFDNDNEKKLPEGIDPNHINIRDLNFGLQDFQFSSTNITGHLREFSFAERSGFSLKEFHTYFQYGEQSAFIKDFYLETPNTKMKSDIVLNYEDVTKLKDNLGNISLDVNVKDTYLGLKDAYILMPSVFRETNMVALKDEEIRLEAKVKGTVDNMLIDRFLLRGLNSTFVNVEGKIKGLPDVNKANLNLTIKDFQTTARDIAGLAPKGVIPTTITVPALMQLSGQVNGSMQDISSKLKLKTSSGIVDLEAKFDQRIKGKEKYDVNAQIVDLAVGHIIQNDSIGFVSMEFRAKGIGINPDKINADAVLKINKAEFNNYTYADIAVDASMHDGHYEITTVNADPNLNFDVQASGVYNDASLSLDLLANLNRIDLKALHLDENSNSISGIIDVKMPNIMPDSLVGTTTLSNFMFDMDGRVFNLQPIVIEAQANDKMRKMTLSSELIDFSMQGEYKLTQLGDAITTSLATYFKRENEIASKATKSESDAPVLTQGQFFNYDVTVKDNSIIQKIVPDLKEISTMEFQGKFVQEDNFLSLKGGIPQLKYGDFEISNIYVDFGPNNNKLVYSLGFDRLANASIALSRINLKGEIYNNVLSYDLNVKDTNQKDYYRIAGQVEAHKEALIVSLNPNGFMLDHQNWIVHPDNRIVLDKKGFYIKDFELSLAKSFLKINSEEAVANSPLKMQFNDFELETLTKLVQKDKVLASGLLGGNLYMKDLATDFRFNTDLTVQDLALMEMPLGNLEVKVKNKTQSEFLASVVLQGGENKVQLNGVVDADKQSMNLELALDKLQMKALENFSMGNLSNSEGFLSGKINVTGSFTDPKILGSIDFNAIGIHVNPINADFKNINEKISFTSRGIEFDKFSITDSDGNLLVIDGQILTKDYKDYAFNMSIVAVDFKAVNSTDKDNDMYYGTLVFDANVKIRGDLNKPIVSGGIEIGKKTSFTVVMPQEDPSIADREGIVEFVDQESLRLAELKRYEDDFNTSALKGLDVTMSIKVDKEALFAMIMDKASGDKVQIEGTGDLVGGIDASGKLTLTGRYEFTKGSYDLSFNFMKRKFLVQPGSSIVWMGEPTSALLDLTAIYETNAAPSDLLEAQIANLSPTQQNMYKQRLPFQALLMMKGELLKPEISFDLKLKEGITSVSGDVISNVNTQLEQIRTNETELNKQVFSLLLLNRFIGENPFESSAGVLSAGQMARQSVSRLLSDQLNNLAGNLIAGVELNFNLDSSEDFSSGSRESRTDLNLAVSKRLFSDRLKVTVGSSFEVEGNQRENEQAANIAGDIELEYALSKDGRYLMRVYRKNSYEVALQGQVVETGVGFVITMSYDKFRELFERTKDKNELKKKLKDASTKE